MSTPDRETRTPGAESRSLWERIGRAEKLASLVVAAITLISIFIGSTISDEGGATGRSGGDSTVQPTRVDSPPPTSTTVGQSSRTDSPATSEAAPVGSAVLFSSSESAIFRSDEFDLDDVGYGDLKVTEESIDGIGRTQISGVVRTDADPTHAECAALPDVSWRTSAPVSEFKNGATYCARLGNGSHSFVVVRSVKLDGGGLLYISARWTTWE